MRIALATNVLKIPPTYFAISHGALLADRHVFEMFALAAYVSDESITVPIHDCSLLPRSSDPVKSLTAAISAGRQASAIHNFGPDLVHLHFGTWSQGAIQGAARSAAPLVTTLHGYDVMALDASPRNAIARWHRYNVLRADEASARVFAVSRFLADKAIRSGLNGDHIEVHYQGIDTNYFTPVDAEKSSEKDEDPLVLFVGVLAQRKGPRDLIAASRALIARRPHRLILMGAGPLELQLRRETANDSHISITGSVSRETVRDAMRQAAMLVLPTQEHQGWQEAAGLVLLEAQSCGTPVIAYDSGGVGEMLIADQTGLLTPEKDIAALGDAIATLLEAGQSAVSSMRASARQFVVEHRSLTASANRLDEHYRDLTSAPL